LPLNSGEVPFVIRVTGPKRLTKLGKGHHQGRTGCGYFVLWEDGPHSSSPRGPFGADCSEGFQHTFEKPGSYTIQATIFRLGPADESITEWTNKVVVHVQAK
jgi:hypothetical protein